MAPQIVYRWQHHESKYGPFSNHDSRPGFDSLLNSMPAPWEEFLGNRRYNIRDERYAMNAEQLAEWTLPPRDLRLFQVNQFRLYRMVVEYALHGKNQVIFSADAVLEAEPIEPVA
jgi:hypothetical protein